MKKFNKYLIALMTGLVLVMTGQQVFANRTKTDAMFTQAFHLTLASFDYIQVNAHTACFTWTTTQEFNVEQIQLEGSTDSIHFVAIDAQTATNLRMGHTYYSPVINIEQFKYYRLVIVNETGDLDYSKIIHITDASITKQNITIFPNPIVSNGFNVKVATMNQIAVNLFTREGVLLYTTRLQGQFEYRINLPNHASDYMNLVVQVSCNGSTQSFNVLNK